MLGFVHFVVFSLFVRGVVDSRVVVLGFVSPPVFVADRVVLLDMKGASTLSNIEYLGFYLWSLEIALLVYRDLQEFVYVVCSKGLFVASLVLVVLYSAIAVDAPSLEKHAAVLRNLNYVLPGYALLARH